jgi:hypothetical protein
MPTARELLEQADLLMRRNRARQVDTEIPELTEAIPFPLPAAEPALAPAPPPAAPSPPTVLDDIPELTDSVEEIEIASIVEIPDYDDETSGWRGNERDGPGEEMPDAASVPSTGQSAEPIGGRVLPLFAIAVKPHDIAAAAPAQTSAPQSVGSEISPATMESAMARAPVVELPLRDATPARGEDSAAVAPAQALPGEPIVPREAVAAPAPNDWARWEALAEEVRMQVLQRIDIFTDTGLREQLSVQLQPIVDRASAELVATINDQIGKLLRAYIAEAIEREIEKWRTGNS